MDSTQSGPAVGTGVSSSNDTPDDWMRVLVVHDVSLKVVLFQSGRLTNSTSTLQLLQREYVDCCDGSESCLNKENFKTVPSILGCLVLRATSVGSTGCEVC
eukprot:m.214836 g.214836  ORF g.214836 m.214836 type:complete len:101 (-) comp15536_c0_seq1:1232-1534(-)